MKFAATIATILLMVGWQNAIAGAQFIRTVALSDDFAPGTSGGVIFSSFRLPVIDAQGRATFQAFLTTASGDNILNNNGIWSESTGTLAKIARKGEQATGAPDGVNYLSFEAPVVSTTGQVAFAATLNGTGVVNDVNDQGIWSGTSDSLDLVVRTGEQVPDAPLEVRFGPERFPIDFQQSPSGELVLNASLVGPGIDSSNDSANWRYKEGALFMISQKGDQAPGLPSGVLMTPDYGVFTRSSDSSTTFSATLTGPGIDSSNNFSIWSEVSGSIRLVARIGDQVQGMPSGVLYKEVYSVGSSSGKTVLRATLKGPEATSFTSGIWLEDAGNLAKIMRTGDPAPGLPEGTLFFSLSSAPFDISLTGQAAFFANFTGGSGLWSGGTETLSLVASLGEHAPGTTGDINFSQFQHPGPALNNAGHIAFAATWIDESAIRPKPRFGTGIWAQDSAGMLQLVAREGDLLEVALGDIRMITSLHLIGELSTGNNDNRSTSNAFNDSNQLAFRATFTDGTEGVFVSNLVAIPEPSTLLLATLAAAGILLRKRR